MVWQDDAQAPHNTRLLADTELLSFKVQKNTPGAENKCLLAKLHCGVLLFNLLNLVTTQALLSNFVFRQEVLADEHEKPGRSACGM